MLAIMNRSAADSSTLVVFFRRPAPGHGKQRIAAVLGVELTAALAGHLLDTALEDAAAWPGPVILAPAAEADRAWAQDLLQRPFEIMPQSSGNLGVRINGIDRAARQDGHRQLFYIGSDAPVLDAGYYARARAALAHCDVILGPAEDGGVTLMGSRREWPDMATLPWSTPELADALEQTCRSRGLTVQRLPQRYDIDWKADLPRLYTDLGSDARPARRNIRRWLRKHQLA